MKQSQIVYFVKTVSLHNKAGERFEFDYLDVENVFFSPHTLRIPLGEDGSLTVPWTNVRAVFTREVPE